MSRSNTASVVLSLLPLVVSHDVDGAGSGAALAHRRRQFIAPLVKVFAPSCLITAVAVATIVPSSWVGLALGNIDGASHTAMATQHGQLVDVLRR